MLSACGRATYIEPVFAPYVSAWEQRTGEKVEGIEMHLVSLEEVRAESDGPKAIATCSGSKLLVGKEMWDTVSELHRHWIVSHELGHCIQGEQHDANPCSIMAARMPSESCVATFILL